MSPVIGQAERACWQRRAAAELARILDGYPELPCIAWTVGPAGSVVVGRVTGLAPAWQVRRVFRARQQALGLAECGEQPGGGGTAWLHAASRCGEVTIRLTATVLGEGQEEGR